MTAATLSPALMRMTVPQPVTSTAAAAAAAAASAPTGPTEITGPTAI
ncbi:hypothetical protein EYF80_063226 [Liparis tanakae]|uniref:Uncharacterized protein n=1 Tax=Liparis tanakae TaxID=230148 RepID=A0A4Z2ECS2_9TELE|nr:hypothetical protein EYF80_063226 [Liparis tanakae]